MPFGFLSEQAFSFAGIPILACSIGLLTAAAYVRGSVE
jgi:hypothetical protein